MRPDVAAHYLTCRDSGMFTFDGPFTFFYEKFMEVVHQRVKGTDEAFRIVFDPDKGLNADGSFISSFYGSFDDAAERYLTEQDNALVDILTNYVKLLDGDFHIVEPLYIGEFEELGIHDSDDPRAVALVEDYLDLDPYFLAAIDGLKSYVVDVVVSNSIGDADDKMYAFRSKMVGAFLEWEKTVTMTKELYRALRLWDKVRDPMGCCSSTWGIKDGEWFFVAIAGNSGYYTDGVWDLSPCFCAAMYLFRDAVERLNKKYKFYKEVKADDNRTA